MRLVVFAALVALAGCVSNANAPVESASQASGAASALAPVTKEWKGRVVDSHLDSLSHVEPSEQAIFAAQQEGFLFDIKALPQVFQVSLDWSDPSAKMMIMLHSHKEHGTNVYDEHDSPLDATHPKCIQVPAADLSTGEWQVMVHTQDARNVDYTLRVTMVGGAGDVVAGKMHGHDLQDGQFQVSDKKVETCAPLAGGSS